MLRGLSNTLIRSFSRGVVLSNFEFNDMSKVEEIVSRYPDKQGAVNPLLHLAQEQSEGWISHTAMEAIAQICEIPDRSVYECAYFYAMYNKEPIGKYHINVCVTTPCMITGGDDILSAIEDHLEIKLGETTSDGLFTLGEMECMGCCTNAPMFAIADYSDANNFKYDYIEDLTVESAIKILDNLKAGKEVTPGSQKCCEECEGEEGAGVCEEPPVEEKKSWWKRLFG